MIRSIVRVILIFAFSAFLNGEYFAHGPDFFDLDPLIRFYIFYAIIIDGLVARFKLGDRSMLLFGGTTGLIIESFLNRSLYGDPFFAGVNLVTVIVMFFAWGLFATVLPLWLSNRMLPREDTKKYKRTRLIVTILGALALLSLLGDWAGSLAPLNQEGAGLMTLIIVVLIAWFVRTLLKRKSYPAIKKKRLVSTVIIFYLLIQLVVGSNLDSGINVDLLYVFLILLGSLIIYFGAWRKHSFILS